MSRIIIHEARAIHLAWHADREAYEFRLLYGRSFQTPKLWISPLDWYDLLMSRALELCNGSEKWLMLRREGGKLMIYARRELNYGLLATIDPQIPSVSFSAFYGQAKAVRGAKPETGWEKVHEAILERQREGWGPA